MEATTKEKLLINIANSWKMLSVWFMGAITALWTLYVSLPQACTPELVGCTISQAWVTAQIAKLPIPAPLLTIGTFLVGYYFRVKPQKGITPEVAAAKSADAVQTPAPLDFPLPTGPAPLPPIERADTRQ